MVRLKIYAWSLIESTIAFVIISIIMSISVVTFSYLVSSDNRLLTIQTSISINQLAKEAKDLELFDNQIIEYDRYTIQKSTTSLSTSTISITFVATKKTSNQIINTREFIIKTNETQF